MTMATPPSPSKVASAPLPASPEAITEYVKARATFESMIKAVKTARHEADKGNSPARAKMMADVKAARKAFEAAFARVAQDEQELIRISVESGCGGAPLRIFAM